MSKKELKEEKLKEIAGGASCVRPLADGSCTKPRERK